jgi:hypothetical protein
MAGAGGFEPPHGGIKIRCLTTWLRPIRRRACPPTARGPSSLPTRSSISEARGSLLPRCLWATALMRIPLEAYSTAALLEV